MKALIQNNIVINLSNTEYPEFENMVWVDCPDECQPAWTYIDGHFAPPVIPEPIYTKEELLNKFTLAMQEFINKTAIEKGYDSALSCASYLHSTNQKWQSESQVFIAWRDLIWEQIIMEYISIEAGADIPNVMIFINSLPKIVWPS